MGFGEQDFGEKMKKIILLVILVGGIMAVGTSSADTVRVYGSPGEGYTDVTTNERGDRIREVKYGEDNVVRESREIDSDGTTRTTKYKNGKLSTRETADEDGFTSEKITYDKQGRVHRRETTDEDFTTSTETYSYDEHGRITQVSRLGPAGDIQESIEFEYDENGKLEKTTRWRDDESGELQRGGHLEFDENGNIKDSEGEVGGLLDDVKHYSKQEFGDANTHVTRDRAGNVVYVRHNPDGSYDVTIVNSEGRVISLQYFASGRCYLGDECPFRHNHRTDTKSLPVTAKNVVLPDYISRQIQS